LSWPRAASGHKDAGEARDKLADRMTDEDIAEAQRLTREWHEKHKKQ
jgi:hypothetical protein